MHYFLKDHLGSVSTIVDGSSEVREQNDYYPFGGQRLVAESRTTANRLKYNGKEVQTTGDWGMLDYGARCYDPVTGRWDKVDPLAEKYYSLSSYNYCLNNPLKYIDPDGTSTWVINNGDGAYRVVGGNINDGSRNIYVINSMEDLLALFESGKTGTILGETLTETSFYNSDLAAKNENPWLGTINPSDMSGLDFFEDFTNNTPCLVTYIFTATNYKQYDFKRLGYDEYKNTINEAEYYYRGMPFGVNSQNGDLIFTSARDIGNFAAGYITAVNKLPWSITRLGFDGYQSIVSRSLTTEGISTQNAQRLGYKFGTNYRWIWLTTQIVKYSRSSIFN